MLDFPHVASQFPYAHEVLYDQAASPPLWWLRPLNQQSQIAALAYSENQIEELSRMEDNWDGYGALRISTSTKFNALASLRGLLYNLSPPEITPNTNGTLSLEWETERGSAHLEIGEKRLSFYIKPKSGQPIFLDASTSDTLLESGRIGSLISNNLFPLQYRTLPITNIELGPHVSAA